MFLNSEKKGSLRWGGIFIYSCWWVFRTETWTNCVSWNQRVMLYIYITSFCTPLHQSYSLTTCVQYVAEVFTASSTWHTDSIKAKR